MLIKKIWVTTKQILATTSQGRTKSYLLKVDDILKLMSDFTIQIFH